MAPGRGRVNAVARHAERRWLADGGRRSESAHPMIQSWESVHQMNPSDALRPGIDEIRPQDCRRTLNGSSDVPFVTGAAPNEHVDVGSVHRMNSRRMTARNGQDPSAGGRGTNRFAQPIRRRRPLPDRPDVAVHHLA
jgi:hypothetical protein